MAKRVVLPKTCEGKTILVAGAAGLIAGHLCEFYLDLGAKVIGLDNFITGPHSTISILEKYDRFIFEECNIYQSLPDFKGISLDYIFSLASPASPKDFDKIPFEIMRVNSEGTMKLLDLAREKNARFLEASTSEVYGEPEVHPQVEEYQGNVNPIGIRACYDESKRYAEALTMNYYRYNNVDTRIVRIFNTYGPRMRSDDGRVISNFINQALRNEDVTVYGDGNQTRSFCFVTDLVKAIHYVMFSTIHTPFNCGNPDEYTIKECAQFIIKSLHSSSNIVYRPLSQDDPIRRRPSISKLQSISDYRPLISFEEGIERTASYFKKMM